MSSPLDFSKASGDLTFAKVIEFCKDVCTERFSSQGDTTSMGICWNIKNMFVKIININWVVKK